MFIGTELLNRNCMLRDSTYRHCNITNIYSVVNSIIIYKQPR